MIDHVELLALVRHASAEGGVDPPLTAYGRLQASALGPKVRELTPLDQVIVSPTRRTVETATLALEFVGGLPAPIVDHRGGAGHDAAVLQAIHERARRVLVVTHDDVIGAVAEALTGSRRLGYERGSVTLLRPGPRGWTATYSRPPEVD